MKIVVVGSGNVATHFARAFHASGNDIAQVYSRNIAHAQVLASQLDAQAVDSFSDLADDAHLYLLAIPDDALYEVVTQISPKQGIVVHTSGSVPMDVLKPLSAKIGVVYSPQTFVKSLEMNYSELPFCLEASDG
ncbi:MAG: NAD(P)-binding domain-containing protein, partial [Bacteroidales bacterium]|nr:NAD(P)-binding domain-containing protein [Bacteroidales bacterium]